MTQDTNHKVASPPAPVSATEQALIDDLDRVLREAFEQPATISVSPAQQSMRPIMPSRTPGAPVMFPAPGPVQDTPKPDMRKPDLAQTAHAAPSSAPIMVEKPVLPAPPLHAHALPSEIKPVETDEIMAEMPRPAARPLRPLPTLEDPVAPPPPIEPISMASARARRWRPAMAITAALMILAVTTHFLMRMDREPAVTTADAPPLISAPATPAVIPGPAVPAEPPAPALPVSPPPAVAAAPSPPPVPPPATPAPAPVVESAGILGEPQVSPFDSVMPSRTVRTTVVAANEAANATLPDATPQTPAKPLSLTDPATWPAGATMAEPHPLPPRRK